MKKAILIGFLMVLIVAPITMADTVTMRRVDGYWTGDGGEFTVQINNNGGSPDLNALWNLYDLSTRNIGEYDPSFQSFCIETNEFVNIGGTYRVEISENAIAGGSGGPTPDPISIGTAWLYHEFQLGRLIGRDVTGQPIPYDYNGPNRDDHAGFLQNTIWWLEGEANEPTSTNPFYNEVLHQFTNATGAKANNVWTYPVAVLNLYGLETGSNKQDQLVCVPVPEPASFLLLGLGLLGVGMFARRRFKK